MQTAEPIKVAWVFNVNDFLKWRIKTGCRLLENPHKKSRKVIITKAMPVGDNGVAMF